MKNLAHPQMFPGVSSGAPVDSELPAVVAREAVVTDADVGGVATTAPPTTAWANPLLPQKLTEIAESPDAPVGRRVTWTARVVEHLKKHGPRTSGELCVAFDIDAATGINPYINTAVKNGLIVRIGKQYALPDQVPAQAGAASAVEKNPPAEAVQEVPKAISHFEKATAIVAMRKQSKTKEAPPAEPGAAPTPTPAAAPAPEPSIATAPVPAPAPVDVVAAPAKPGRKPLQVVSVGELQLLAWAGGGITIQTEDASIELEAVQTRALLVLAELHT